MPESMAFRALDYSFRSPFGPPNRRSTRSALLSGIRRNDDFLIIQRPSEVGCGEQREPHHIADGREKSVRIATLTTPNKKRHAGFTLVEMVMVILVVGLLTITLGKLLNTGVIAFDEGRKVIDTLSSLRLTTERLARELRTVRRNPAVPGDFDFLAKSATSVQFRRLENDGITVTTVTINAAPPNLTLAYDTPVGSYILADQLGSLALSYLRADGTITTSNTDVAFVVIDLNLTDSNANNYPQRTRVALRNRQ
jgi:prepilin-type N-terminal cleavage/methylation domain-containing protein